VDTERFDRGAALPGPAGGEILGPGSYRIVRAAAGSHRPPGSTMHRVPDRPCGRAVCAARRLAAVVMVLP
jgi:hypothetical protein